MKNLTFEIRTDIRISPISVADAGALANLIHENVSHFGEFLPMVVNLASRQEAELQLQKAVCAFASGETLDWHIFKDDILCGAVRVKNVDPIHKTAEIGYFVGKAFQGKGIVTSSVSAVIEHCFGHLGLNRIELKCAVNNGASIRVAKRLGFLLEGTHRQSEILHGVFIDNHVFALLHDDFRLKESHPNSV